MPHENAFHQETVAPPTSRGQGKPTEPVQAVALVRSSAYVLGQRVSPSPDLFSRGWLFGISHPRKSGPMSGPCSSSSRLNLLCTLINFPLMFLNNIFDFVLVLGRLFTQQAKFNSSMTIFHIDIETCTRCETGWHAYLTNRSPWGGKWHLLKW